MESIISRINECIEKADKITDQLLNVIEKHRNEFIQELLEPINDRQKRIQQLTIDNGWLTQKPANHEALLPEFGDRLNKIDFFLKGPGNSHFRKGLKK